MVGVRRSASPMLQVYPVLSTISSWRISASVLSARLMPLGGQHTRLLPDTNSNWGLSDRPGAEAGRIAPGRCGQTGGGR